MLTQRQDSIEQIIARIQALDLEPIKFKLMDSEEGQGWSREYVDEMEVAYKRFLTLSVKYPEETIAPSKDVDKFWHGHILDTMKYADDCQDVFGYFLHHFPYFGMRGNEDAANLVAAGRRTNELYAHEFGADAGPTVEHDVAMCAAAKPAAAPAMCAAARRAASPAMCAAARRAVSPAMCAAAKPAAAPAMCAAARRAASPAMCAAAKRVNSPAMCAAAKPSHRAGAQAVASANAPLVADRLNVASRPKLPLAA